MHYLFHVLAGIDIYWIHLVPSSTICLDRLFSGPDFGDAVYLLTDRSEESQLDSWRRRKRGKGRCSRFEHTMWIKKKYAALIETREHVVLPIEGSIEEKTLAALKVLGLLGVIPNKHVRQFMETWPRINAFSEQDEQPEFTVTPGKQKLLSKSLRQQLKYYLTLHKE